jgi:tRNA(Glu) U13 pseudouridine synthase TruD
LLTLEENAACFAFRLPAGSFATSVLREVLRDA